MNPPPSAGRRGPGAGPRGLGRLSRPVAAALGAALRRQLRELPALRDGLSLSERLILEIVRDGDQPSAGQVFAERDRPVWRDAPRH
ncbi:hypothetical protein AOA77_24620 [Pseudomonas paraeruginosa]|nr:hypothetical protein AOA77_24620 [Pseudomonas paraeruginosa]KRU98422.1 hypothetical protein AN454_08885 [Pseudomonas aeruginosa]VTL98215.1 Uncharacterised protein [Pseudomonas aeruginosa]